MAGKKAASKGKAPAKAKTPAKSRSKKRTAKKVASKPKEAKAAAPAKKKRKKGKTNPIVQEYYLKYARMVAQAKKDGKPRPKRPPKPANWPKTAAEKRRETTMPGDMKSDILEMARKAKTAKRNMPDGLKTGLNNLAKLVKNYHGRYC